MEPPGILAVGIVSAFGVHSAADDHFDGRLGFRTPREITIMSHDNPDVVVMIKIFHQT
jgi:hypothetical protein